VCAERRGPLVRVRVRLADGTGLESVTTGIDHPRPGEAVAVEVDPSGAVEVPVWEDGTR
jgi:hypothetical protein